MGKKLRVIFDRGQKIKLILLFGILLFSSFLESIGVSMILPFVEFMMDEEHSGKTTKTMEAVFSTDSHVELLFWMGLCLAVVYLFKTLYLLFAKYIQLRFVYNNRLELSGRLMRSYMKKPYSFHLEKNSAGILRSVTSDVNNLYEWIMDGIDLTSNLLIIGMLTILLLVTDPLMTLVVSAVLGFFSLLYVLIIRKRMLDYGRKNQYFYGRMIRAINQALGGIKEIKVLAREEYFVQDYAENGRQYVSSLKRSQWCRQIPRYLLETICVFSVVGTLLFCLASGKEVQEMIPRLAVFALAAFRLLPSINQVNNLINAMQFLSPSVDSVYQDLIETKEETEKNKMVLQEESKEVLDENAIHFEHVSFTYPGTTQKILSDVSVSLPLRHAIGFVGSSGAGKTTFMDLFLGLLVPDSGRICLGRDNICDIAKEWRQKIGYIPQNIYLSDDTIRRNIAFGIPDSQICEERVQKALKEAQLWDFVIKLDNGLDTMVGESGVRLSGGQRQRIGIARALYQEPEILLMDEATSALDSETERAVMEAVEHLRGKCTLLLIAHRTSTLKECDSIYKIENGKLLPELLDIA